MLLNKCIRSLHYAFDNLIIIIFLKLIERPLNNTIVVSIFSCTMLHIFDSNKICTTLKNQHMSIITSTQFNCKLYLNLTTIYCLGSN